jgi:SAM-dependent methyltransferase
MLELARENAERLHSDVTIVAGGFGEIAGIVGEPVDAITCTGNALPHVRSIRGLHDALHDFAAALRPGGALVLHYLNHHRLLTKHVRTMTPVFREAEAGDKFFLRLLDYTPEGDGILFDFATLVRDRSVRDGRHTIESWPKTLEDDPSGGWSIRSRRSLHFAMPLEFIAAELERTGFLDVRAYGDHSGKPLDLEEDESQIIVATRA